MILEIDGWKFQIFDVTTRKYYAREVAEHCTCAPCRNFYQAVDKVYPELRPFLAQFGVHIEAPDEMISFTATLCSNNYGVCGRILERGDEPLTVGGVTVEPMSEGEAMTDSGCPEPRFFLCAQTMKLPWVLDEAKETASSPAQEKNAISRLLERWIDT